MQNRLTNSNLELRGPRTGLEIGSRSSRKVRSAAFFAQVPNLLTKAGLEGARGREIANSRIPIRKPPIRAQSFALYAWEAS
eukprot:2776516-Alexandrium_andersonii.AAC.1